MSRRFTGSISEYASRRFGDSIWIESTEGYFWFNGEYLEAHINVRNKNTPEIPDTQILGSIPWVFEEVRFLGNTARIIFSLEDIDLVHLSAAVEYYNFLYGWRKEHDSLILPT